MDIEHLDGGELVEYGARSEAGGKRAKPRLQGDVQAVGEESEKMCASMRPSSW